MTCKHEHKNAMQSGHVARSLGKARAIGRGRSTHGRRVSLPLEEKQPAKVQDRNDGYR
jgi:hypothetical protein